MIHILAEAAIEDLARFLEVFSTDGLQARRKHGCRSSRIFTIDQDEKRIYILFEWSSKKAFAAFQADALVRETMKKSGTLAPPKFTFLEKAAELEN